MQINGLTSSTILFANSSAQYSDSYNVKEISSRQGMKIDLLDKNSNPTGSNVYVKKDDSYTKNNPVFVVSGKDKYGNEFKKKINVNDIKPKDASFIEMSALHAHLSLSGDLSGNIAKTFKMPISSDEDIMSKKNYLTIYNDALREVDTSSGVFTIMSRAYKAYSNFRS